MELDFEPLSVYGKVYAIDTPGHGAHSVVGPAAACSCLSTHLWSQGALPLQGLYCVGSTDQMPGVGSTTCLNYLAGRAPVLRGV